ncbi:type VI secretion system-associated FHA domain protein [Terricaulis sp.]|uniref:type VI secretion system-associated FHA domain protein n=1 Tax=Terricaulis sp. TaxID=2768686 RepID=UPI0037847E6F
MITLRLFNAADPFKELESRALADSSIVVGRDPGVDWVVNDASAEISRRHCVLASKDGRIVLRDTSANGVYLGDERLRVARDSETEVSAGDTIHLGQFMIVIDASLAVSNVNDVSDSEAAGDGSVLDAPFHAPLLQDQALKSADFAVPSEWCAGAAPASPSPSAASAPLTNAALLDAFCAGAHLDASSFAGHDPVEVLRRAGAMYRQMVLGINDLMTERTSVKAEYRMDRTTVGAVDNNPFKWAAPQRVAVDLLCGRDDNFLAGPAALRASFEDLKKHLLCLLAGSRAAVNAAFENLGPPKVEEAAKPLPLVGKGEALWRAYQRHHEELAADARANPDSAVNRAFKRGYEAQLRALDEMGTLS